MSITRTRTTYAQLRDILSYWDEANDNQNIIEDALRVIRDSEVRMDTIKILIIKIMFSFGIEDHVRSLGISEMDVQFYHLYIMRRSCGVVNTR